MKKLLFTLLILICANVLFAQTPPAPPRPREAPSAMEQPTLPPEPPAFLGPEQEKEALDFIQTVAPFRVEILKKMKQFDYREYQKRLLEVFQTKIQLDMLKQTDPDQYQSRLDEIKMDQESNRLGEEYRKTGSQEEKDRIRGNLKTVLNQLFDVREKNKQAEVKHLEEQLAKLKSTMADRKKNKEQIVQNRLEDLIDEGNGMRW
jgi:hypothetical protein